MNFQGSSSAFFLLLFRLNRERGFCSGREKKTLSLRFRKEEEEKKEEEEEKEKPFSFLDFYLKIDDNSMIYF